jgi:hypothetical protein
VLAACRRFPKSRLAGAVLGESVAKPASTQKRKNMQV